jgi:hypothetical protein
MSGDVSDTARAAASTLIARPTEGELNSSEEAMYNRDGC